MILNNRFVPMNLRRILFIVTYVLAISTVKAQILTKEDSLAANLNFKSNTSVLSGYGEVFANVNGGMVQVR